MQIKNKDFNEYQQPKIIESLEYDEDSTIHHNAFKISETILKNNNLKSFYIEETFGYGKSEVVKYLKVNKKQFNLKEWNITYIDATVLEIMEDNKVWVLANILEQVIESSKLKNTDLRWILSKLQIEIQRKTTGMLDISNVITNIKFALAKSNNLIIFDELDRVSKKFSKFLMVSIGNNIKHTNTKILWVLSNRERIFGIKNQGNPFDEFDKYGEYKISLDKHDIFKIFLNQTNKAISNFELSLIEHKVPRYIERIAKIFDSSHIKKEHVGIRKESDVPLIELMGCILLSIQHKYKLNLGPLKLSKPTAMNDWEGGYTLEEEYKKALKKEVAQGQVIFINDLYFRLKLKNGTTTKQVSYDWGVVFWVMKTNGWINE